VGGGLVEMDEPAEDAPAAYRDRSGPQRPEGLRIREGAASRLATYSERANLSDTFEVAVDVDGAQAVVEGCGRDEPVRSRRRFPGGPLIRGAAPVPRLSRHPDPGRARRRRA